MRCSDFEKRLGAFLNGDLAAAEREAALMHLENCSECRQTTQIARGDMDLEPERSRGDFVSAVLELTSGATCQHARRHLCDFVDGVLTCEYSRVVAGHLQTCSECSALFVALTELAEVLPEMALLKPDHSFTDDVLALTISSPEEVCRTPHPVWRFLETIFQRPRFSWEAAYVGTLLIMAIWGGVATPPVTDGSSQTLASTQISLRRLAYDFQRSLPEQWFRERTERINREITGKYIVWKRNAGYTISYVRQELAELPLDSGQYLKLKAGKALTVASNHLEDFWEKFPLDYEANDNPPNK